MKTLKMISLLLSLLLIAPLFLSYVYPVTGEVVSPPNMDTQVTTNPFYSSPSDTIYYHSSGNESIGFDDNSLQLRANCYGFALRMFCSAATVPYTGYRQQPGEFAEKDPYFFINGEMIEDYGDVRDLINGGGVNIDILVELVSRDMQALGYSVLSTAKYTEASQIPSASTLTGGRLILLVVGSYDYHFYMQNSDNTWSHKPGAYQATTKCRAGLSETASNDCAHPTDTLTNNNILSHMHDGPYDTDYIFLHVSKPAIIDFSHGYGHDASCDQTVPDHIDHAGHTRGSAQILQADTTVVNGRISYLGDADYYLIFFQSSGSRTFEITTVSTGTTPDPYPIQLSVYNASGGVLGSTSLVTTGNGSVTISTSSYTVYYIRVISSGQSAYENGRGYRIDISQ